VSYHYAVKGGFLRATACETNDHHNSCSLLIDTERRGFYVIYEGLGKGNIRLSALFLLRRAAYAGW
ncbi:MAG TPA: hypothetical protein VN023_06975, partial [Methylovorus sp.]|nr:hypothetical protein [Methylovorus sp.]